MSYGWGQIFSFNWVGGWQDVRVPFSPRLCSSVCFGLCAEQPQEQCLLLQEQLASDAVGSSQSQMCVLGELRIVSWAFLRLGSGALSLPYLHVKFAQWFTGLVKYVRGRNITVQINGGTRGKSL